MQTFTWIMLSIITLVIGFAIGFFLLKFLPVMKAKEASRKADKILRDAEIRAEQIKKNAQIDGKQLVAEMRQEADKDIRERKQEYANLENKLNQREQNIDRRDANLLNKENALEQKNDQLNRRLSECDKKEKALQEKIDSIIVELEKVGQLSVNEARDQIFERVESKMTREIASYMKTKEEEAKAEAEANAKEILSMAISKYAQEEVQERTVSVVALPSDEMKGRIIGREGRNIRTLEQLLGVDLVIDDTPEVIT